MQLFSIRLCQADITQLPRSKECFLIYTFMFQNYRSSRQLQRIEQLLPKRDPYYRNPIQQLLEFDYSR